MTVRVTHLNGHPATAADLAPLAFAGYAHFTAMQMRNHAVRGLDLHLERLLGASDRLFGQHLPSDRILEYLRKAVDAAGAADASVTCFITPRPGEFAPAGPALALDVLVKITEPARPPTGPLSLDVVRHERDLPEVKHVGEVGKTFLLRYANTRGFDDAAFVDHAGRLSEATIWNLAFWDGESVIWPDASFLRGVTMQILARRLRSTGVPQRIRAIRPADLDDSLSAVVMNSWTPGIPVSHIAGRTLARDPDFPPILNQAYLAESGVALVE